MTLQRIQTRRASGFPARLKQALDPAGGIAAAASAIGRSEGAVRKWLRGLSEPGVTDLRALSEFTQTRIDWLVAGRGSVSDQPAAHDPPIRAPLDSALLERVLGAIEQRLRETSTTLSVAKHAVLSAACYDLAHQSGTVDPNTIARLVRLAG
jgi:transcriptional regulator with XRE-family HTH domain